MTTADMTTEQAIGRLWWMWLVTGILWILFSVIILQFNTASAAAVGIIFGVMLFVAGLQDFAVASIVREMKWLWFVFGGILVIGGLFAMFYPVETFLALADILGFIFVFIGIMWIVQALMAKDVASLWWLNLAAGIIMVVMGFWLGGQFFITKAYTLLVFAGIYALMKGVTDIVLAFEIKRHGGVPTGSF